MKNNTTTISEFILDCAIDPQQKIQIAAILIIIYFITLLGNSLVIFIIKCNRHLHTPMFLYIGTLAFIDLLNSTTVNPKIVANILGSSAILYGLCFFQMIFRSHLSATECFLFALMACDRYVAVLHPLRYPALITNKLVWICIFILNVASVVLFLPFVCYGAELSFCRDNVLPYCFCDYVTLVQLSCTEDPKYLFILSPTFIFVSIIPIVVIIITYIKIAKAALKISSGDETKKVYSTCLTHLIVMGLFFLPLAVTYGLPGMGVRLSNEARNEMEIIVNVVPPMLNPIIYSFRNHDIKKSIYKMFFSKRALSKL